MRSAQEQQQQQQRHTKDEHGKKVIANMYEEVLCSKQERNNKTKKYSIKNKTYNNK